MSRIFTETQRMRAVWRSMRHRCGSEKSSSYANYGGRGIKVCKRWASFEAFLEDIGPQPFPRAEIDRRNNDRGYCPSNVRWANRRTQTLNSRHAVMVDAFGESKSLIEWSEDPRCTCSYPSLHYRIVRANWSATDAITTPNYGKKHPKGHANAKV